ncbi:MAG TPA: hypothetical protein VG890_05810 [Puia sp.]|nr:hypothetical protein [Puia sp.]
MKLVFFLLAFCVIAIRVYFGWRDHDRHSRGIEEGNMEIRSDNLNESIRYSGKFGIADDEQSLKSITPGSWLKFRKNDLRMEAQSNLGGQIAYTLRDGSRSVDPGEPEGRMMIATVVHEMIGLGFDARARMERVYQRAGAAGLLKEVDSLRISPLKMQYFEKLTSIDSPALMPEVIKKIGAFDSDPDRTQLLGKIPLKYLNDSLICAAYFGALSNIGSDLNSMNILARILDENTLSARLKDSILLHAGKLGSDLNRSEIFEKLIERGLDTAQTDRLLGQIAPIGSDLIKMNLYRKVLNTNTLNESGWMSLIDLAGQLGSDIDKVSLLTEIAEKMPVTKSVEFVYRQAARTIGNDGDYGHAIRALESRDQHAVYQ